jgi:hypothetical protein
MRFLAYFVYSALLLFVIFSTLQMTESFQKFIDPMGYWEKQVRRERQVDPKREVYLPLKNKWTCFEGINGLARRLAVKVKWRLQSELRGCENYSGSDQQTRLENRLQEPKSSVDFSGHWQRHVAQPCNGCALIICCSTNDQNYTERTLDPAKKGIPAVRKHPKI